MPAQDPLLRPTSRVIVLSPSGRLLLFRANFPDEASGKPFWVAPGGGVEAGESYEQAAERELLEETGLTVPIGPCLWHREHVWRFPDTETWVRSVERYFVAYSSDDTAVDRNVADPGMQWVDDLRWWSIGEILASEDVFVPRQLGTLVAELIEGRLPSEPIDLGEG